MIHVYNYNNIFIMNISELFSAKTNARDILQKTYNLPQKSKVLIGVSLDTESTHFLLPWLKVLPVNFIIFWKEITHIDAHNISYASLKDSFDMLWIDAIFWNHMHTDIQEAMKIWIVPIIHHGNKLWNKLTEFEPIHGTGNSYLYEDASIWSSYYCLIRYIENHNFSYDNRNLVKNVIETYNT